MLPTPSSHIFTHLNPQSPPSPPGPDYTRFVCISDTHSRSFCVPPGDVLLHAGDLSSWGNVAELKKTIDWLKSLPHPIKIIIAGNHDLCLDQGWADVFSKNALEAAKDLVCGSSARQAGIRYLEHESVNFTTAQGRRWKVYGSPAAPRYVEGAFQYTPGPEGQEIYARIPVDIGILLTHTPPYEAHDTTKRGKHAGCIDLAARLQELEEASATKLGIPHASSRGAKASVAAVEPGDRQDIQMAAAWNCRLHVWGHIHEAYGASVKSGPNGECVQVNAALAWGREPVIVDLHNSQDKSP